MNIKNQLLAQLTFRSVATLPKAGFLFWEIPMRPIVRERILKKCNNKCVYCGSTEYLEVDHIIPLSRGGRENEDNMQILCRHCNRTKRSGVDFEKYFQIGISPEYILVKKDMPLYAFKKGEFKKIFLLMIDKNDDIFGIYKREGRGY